MVKLRIHITDEKDNSVLILNVPKNKNLSEVQKELFLNNMITALEESEKIIKKQSKFIVENCTCSFGNEYHSSSCKLIDGEATRMVI